MTFFRHFIFTYLRYICDYLKVGYIFSPIFRCQIYQSLKTSGHNFAKIKLKSIFLLCHICLVLFLPKSILSIESKIQNPDRINLSSHDLLLYLPLDERFTTRDLFLSGAKITTYRILTPNPSMLPRKKIQPDIKALLEWTRNAANNSKIGVISADMFLYGGLIASRISGDSFEDVQERLKILEKIHSDNPQLQLFVSSTVMRMPAYPSAEEEPEYYAQYGREIFLFSFHSHRYEELQDAKDKTVADTLKFRSQFLMIF
jgi:PAS domain-containing protein